MEFFTIIFDFLTNVLNSTEGALAGLIDFGSSLSSKPVPDVDSVPMTPLVPATPITPEV